MAQADLERAPALPGFDVLLQKELLDARRSRRMIVFAAIMSFLLALVPIIGYFNIDTLSEGGRHHIPGDDMEDMLASWAGIAGYLGALRVIAASIDAVVRERSLGVTAWIITKPVSRLSYLLAKAAGQALTAAIAIIGIPSLVWLLLTLALFQDVPVANVVGSMLILYVEVGFLAATTVALGVPLRSVTPIALVALGLWFIPTIAPVVASLEWTFYVLPSYLPVAAIIVIYDGFNETETITIPLFSAAIAVLVFMGAVSLFEQQEL